MEFIEAPPFNRKLSEYFDDEAYRQFQVELAANPERGDVIPGTGGFRKLRWPDPRRGKGRWGGLRIIYYYFAGDQQLWLITLYGKNEAADLSHSQKKYMRSELELELKSRQTKRLAQTKGFRRIQ
jgi:hypothetical protein